MTAYIVSSGQTALNITMSHGDTLNVLGTAINTTNAGALAFVQSGGEVVLTTLERGAELIVSQAAQPSRVRSTPPAS